MEIIKSMKYST